MTRGGVELRTVMRKLFAVVVLVALTGVLPAAASVAACAKHSCCARPARTVDAHRSCCTVAAAPASAPREAEQVVAATVVMPAPSTVTVAAPHATAHPRNRETASPPTSRRLAALSTLLI